MAPHVAGLRARGIDARAVDLPEGGPSGRSRVRGAPRAAGSAPAPDRTGGRRPAADSRPIAVGGHSFGGRVASLAAADACDAGRPPLALVLLSYPLHAPGRRDDWDARTAHWPRLTCPVILLSGSSDPFATPALLARARSRNACPPPSSSPTRAWGTRSRPCWRTCWIASRRSCWGFQSRERT